MKNREKQHKAWSLGVIAKHHATYITITPSASRLGKSRHPCLGTSRQRLGHSASRHGQSRHSRLGSVSAKHFTPRPFSVTFGTQRITPSASFGYSRDRVMSQHFTITPTHISRSRPNIIFAFFYLLFYFFTSFYFHSLILSFIFIWFFLSLLLLLFIYFYFYFFILFIYLFYFIFIFIFIFHVYMHVCLHFCIFLINC